MNGETFETVGPAGEEIYPDAPPRCVECGGKVIMGTTAHAVDCPRVLPLAADPVSPAPRVRLRTVEGSGKDVPPETPLTSPLLAEWTQVETLGDMADLVEELRAAGLPRTAPLLFHEPELGGLLVADRVTVDRGCGGSDGSLCVRFHLEEPPR